MRHDDPTINSILEADTELHDLESAWFVSLLEFFEAYCNHHSAEALNAAGRNVERRKSDFNLAAGQTTAMLEHVFDFMRNGNTCWRECCVKDSSSQEESGLSLDPLHVMGPDIVF